MKLLSTFQRLLPALGPVSPAERLRVCCGALVGLLVTGLVCRLGGIERGPNQGAAPETRLAALVPVMTEAGLRHVPIVDRDDPLVGLVTQTDLLAGLFGERAARPDLRRTG